jgi:hypothetical protein
MFLDSWGPVGTAGVAAAACQQQADDWQDSEYDEEADCPDSGRAKEPGEQYRNITAFFGIVAVLYRDIFLQKTTILRFRLYRVYNFFTML